MTPTCSRCGRVNRSGATFCAGCGQPLAASSGRPALHVPKDLERYAQQARVVLGRLWGQTRQEAAGWYHDLVARQPEVVGEVVTPPVSTTVTQTTQFYALFLPAGSQTTQSSAVSFDIRPQSGAPVQAVYMVGSQSGGALYVADKVRAWGVWDRDQGVLRAWRVEVWERRGRPASDIVTTGRPFPLLLISAVLLGFLLLTCLCGVLTR
jgi:hypothetical protein